MAQPTAYERIASFSNLQAQAPSDPPPGNTLDAEFNAIKVTLDEILANLEIIQRDDGELANESVGLDQLSDEIEVGWTAPEVWVTATAYVVGNTVFHGSSFYRCLVAHTAGTFATDLAADKWEEIVDLSGIPLVDADQIAVTPAGGIAATNVQDALEELDSEKAAVSHTHVASAISDSTAAGRALLTAANVAAQQAALGLGDLAFEDEVLIDSLDENFVLAGIIDASLSGDINDWAPTGVGAASTVRVAASGAVNVTGMLAPAEDGTVRIIENVGSYPLTLVPSSVSSAAANRFLISKPLVVGPNASVVLKYDLDGGSTPRWRVLDRLSVFPRGHIDGLILSNNASDATNDIDVSAGECRGSRGILDMVTLTGGTKRLDADFAEGGGQGMRYSGAAITDTTYHLFFIGKPDGTTDLFAYAGGLDPTSVLPSGFVDYRRIGSIIRTGGAIVAFTQYGDYFQKNTPSADISATNPGTSAVTRTLLVPTGIVVEADVYVGAATGGTAAGNILITALTAADTAPSSTIGDFLDPGGGAGSSGGRVRVWTNTSGQIRSRIANSAADVTLKLSTRGWRDLRGKDS